MSVHSLVKVVEGCAKAGKFGDVVARKLRGESVVPDAESDVCHVVGLVLFEFRLNPLSKGLD